MICGRFYAAQGASQPGDFTLVAVIPLALHQFILKSSQPKPTTTGRQDAAAVRRYFGDQDNLHVHNLNVSIEQCLLFPVSVHHVSFTETNQISMQGYIEHKSRIVTNFSTKDVSIRLCYIYDQVI